MLVKTSGAFCFEDNFSNSLPRGEAGGPSPLKIEPAQMSGYIHHFPDEIQTWYFPALHCLGREFIGVHAAGGDLGLCVPFCGLWRYRPVMGESLDSVERMICPVRRSMQIHPTVSEAVRQGCPECRLQRGKIAA